MKHNYKYGKLINGKIEYAPYPLKIDGYDVYGATAEQHLKAGYKHIIIENYPQDEKIYVPIYTETETEIIISWKEEDIIEK